MTMNRDNGLVDILYIFFQETDLLSVLVRQAVAVGVGYVHHGSACRDDRLYHLSQVIYIGPAGIFSIKFDILHSALGIFDGFNGTLQYLLARTVEFMLDVHIR